MSLVVSRAATARMDCAASPAPAVAAAKIIARNAVLDARILKTIIHEDSIQYWRAAVTEWTRPPALAIIAAMTRYRHTIYARSRTPRYIVVWSCHWELIEVQKIAALADLASAMAATFERLRDAGWVLEDPAEFGFTFMRKGAVRRLLVITERDPASVSQQSFNPFRMP
jgi:hypothetical protein